MAPTGKLMCAFLLLAATCVLQGGAFREVNIHVHQHEDTSADLTEQDHHLDEVHECEGSPVTRSDADIFFTSSDTFKELLGWSMFAVVTALGEGDYREEVFKMTFEKAFPDLTAAAVEEKLKVISFGETYQLEYSLDDLLKDIKEVALAEEAGDDDRYYFFTATDPAGLGHATHFISYILDRKEKKVHVFDPAEGPNGIGMMQGNQAYISDTEVALRKSFKEWGYADIAYFPKSYAPQTDEDDTYCQSWSLYLAIQGFVKIVEGKTDPIEIPATRIGRYEMLTNFWKSCFSLRSFVHGDHHCSGFSDFCEHQYRSLRWHNGLSETYCSPDDIDGHESELLFRVAEARDICLVSMDAHSMLTRRQKSKACSDDD
mmetsp:Transcript_64046/g.152744  ORF Transcript_64046/g.152744 Transcript_64046/m.152744 type:complete len:373 (-) Transcript_64046:166-1284(-)